MKPWQMSVLLGVVLVAVGVFVAKGMVAEPAKPQADTVQMSLAPQAQFEAALNEKRPILALFHSLTCVPCKLMEERVNLVRPEFQDRVAFVDVNVYDSQNQNFIRSARVRAIPTTLLVDAQGRGQTIVGAVSEEDLREQLRQLLIGFSSE